MDLGLNGRTAIVCGGSAGIGLGIAEALADEGVNLVLFARRPEPLEQQAKRLGGVAVAGDVRDAEDLERLVRTAVEEHGRIDILVNNSGGPPRATAVGLTAEQVSDAASLLLGSVVRLTGLCLPHLERSPAGRIVNVTSSTVREPIDNLVLSNAVRPGVVGWAKSLSRELGPRGITVNSIAPGRVDTERIREVWPDGPSAEDLKTIPLGRLGMPRELGDVVAFLCSDRASYVTGTVIAVDGGLIRGLLQLKKLAGAAVALGLVGLAATFVLWVLPSEEFIFAPNSAKPLADRVEVENARPAGEEGVYYVDVLVRRTSILEDLLPFTRPEGSTVVPEQAILPPGTSEAERDRQTAAEMQRSEAIASVVALRELGYDPEVTPLGALVTGTFADTPALGKLELGDVVVAVDGEQVLTPTELRDTIGTREPGDSVTLTVKRDGKNVDVSLRTIPSPTDPSQPIVGIQVGQEADIELPFDVDIDLGSVGGPSAGLPFALEIARQLGRDVTGGCRVAATGELELDGSVGSVGGLEQKTIGARRTDVDVFLVPAGQNAEEAQEHANGLLVVPVESFQQALRELETVDLNC